MLTSFDTGGYSLFFDKGNHSSTNQLHQEFLLTNHSVNNLVIKLIFFNYNKLNF